LAVAKECSNAAFKLVYLPKVFLIAYFTLYLISLQRFDDGFGAIFKVLPSQT
jgi:hypothetical protein